MPMRWESRKESEIAGVVEVGSGRRDHEPAWCVCVCVSAVCRSGRSVVCLRRHGHTQDERAGCRARVWFAVASGSRSVVESYSDCSLLPL